MLGREGGLGEEGGREDGTTNSLFFWRTQAHQFRLKMAPGFSPRGEKEKSRNLGGYKQLWQLFPMWRDISLFMRSGNYSLLGRGEGEKRGGEGRPLPGVECKRADRKGGGRDKGGGEGRIELL